MLKTFNKIVAIFFVIALFVGCGKLPASEQVTPPNVSDKIVENDATEETEASQTNQTENVDSNSDTETDEADVELESQQEEHKTFTICMVGDVLLHMQIEKAAVMEDGSYSFDELFAHTKEDIRGADLAIVNQEVILGGSELGIAGYPCFNAPYEVADTLAEVGFDVVCHGTNHALDKGKQGILNCLSNWKEKYPEIEILGIHDSAEAAKQICVIETELGRIAILNYTYGTNGIELPQDMPYAVDYLNKNKVMADIEKAKELADFIIVCPHWGTEYQLEPDKKQKEWSTFFAENGVNLVLGTHPHVIEPIEWVQDTLVYYSLGNYVNSTAESGKGVMNRMVGGMAKITLSLDKDGAMVIESYDVQPLIAHLTKGRNGITVYKMQDYTEELASENLIRGQDDSFSLANCKSLVQSVWNIVSMEE